jgi:hypothetical protein
MRTSIKSRVYAALNEQAKCVGLERLLKVIDDRATASIGLTYANAAGIDGHYNKATLERYCRAWAASKRLTLIKSEQFGNILITE